MTGSPAADDGAALRRSLGRQMAIGLLAAIAGVAAIATEFVLCAGYDAMLVSPRTARERFCMGDNLWALLVPTLVFGVGLAVAILSSMRRRDLRPSGRP